MCFVVVYGKQQLVLELSGNIVKPSRECKLYKSALLHGHCYRDNIFSVHTRWLEAFHTGWLCDI